MKNKVSLQLMELLVMILVFSLAAALCLQVFARAVEISRETECRDQAVILARNAAELLKATAGDTEAAEHLSRDGFRVTVKTKPARLPGLGEAEIQVFYEDQIVFCLDTGWQEVLP